MIFCKLICITLLCLLLSKNTFAQKDSLKIKDTTTYFTADSSKQKKEKINLFFVDKTKPYNPKYAILRSAILPGWGQATNKKYWKIPIVYGALGTTVGVFFWNFKQYKLANNAFHKIQNGDTSLASLGQPYYTWKSYPSSIQNARNGYRQTVDYCGLIFLAFWGLNVVDAAVDAHLKTFDVSNNLSLQIFPGYSPMANTNGISLILHIAKNNHPKPLPQLTSKKTNLYR